MTQLFVNNFRTRLAAPLAANATVMYLESAAGLPQMTPEDKNTLNVTLFRGDGFRESGWEVVTITSRIGNACTVIRSTEGAAPSLFAVENTLVEARITAGSLNNFKDSWLPLNGGNLIGPLSARAVTSYAEGAAQPRVEMASANGEPTLTMSRWTGQGIKDHAWRFTNDNGTLRVQYSGTDRTTPSYADKFIVGTMGIQALVPFEAPAIGAIRLPSGSNETGAASGWMKIAKVRMGRLGTDFVIRVSGTTSYSSIIDGSNGAVTTILGRIDNDNKIRGSVYTQGMGPFGNPSDVIFGDDGTIYMAVGQFNQLSVHIDVHSSIWEPQAVEYYSPILTPPLGNKAVKGWSLNLEGAPTFVVTPKEISTNVNYRGLNIWPATTNAYALGTGALAYTTVYLTTGSINASDARLKCDFRDLTAAEINAARDIARAIGVYRWKDSVEAKSADAREHIGPTVQKAIEIMEKYELDPFNYGFICHDEWDREVIEHPGTAGVEATPAVEEVPEEIDDDGNVLVEYAPARPAQLEMPGREAYTEVIREAGDRYAFRYDELAMFIAAGHEARLAALELH